MNSFAKFSSSNELENLTNVQGGKVKPTTGPGGQDDAYNQTEAGTDDCPYSVTCNDGNYKMADLSGL